MLYGLPAMGYDGWFWGSIAITYIDGLTNFTNILGPGIYSLAHTCTVPPALANQSRVHLTRGAWFAPGHSCCRPQSRP